MCLLQPFPPSPGIGRFPEREEVPAFRARGLTHDGVTRWFACMVRLLECRYECRYRVLSMIHREQEQRVKKADRSKRLREMRMYLKAAVGEIDGKLSDIDSARPSSAPSGRMRPL